MIESKRKLFVNTYQSLHLETSPFQAYNQGLILKFNQKLDSMTLFTKKKKSIKVRDDLCWSTKILILRKLKFLPSLSRNCVKLCSCLALVIMTFGLSSWMTETENSWWQKQTNTMAIEQKQPAFFYPLHLQSVYSGWYNRHKQGNVWRNNQRERNERDLSMHPCMQIQQKASCSGCSTSIQQVEVAVVHRVQHEMQRIIATVIVTQPNFTLLNKYTQKNLK